MGNNRLVIDHADVLAEDMTILHDQRVVCEKGMITGIYPCGRLNGVQEDMKRSKEYQRMTDNRECGRDETEQIIDGRGKLLMPGLCDSHMHTGQQLLRGKVLDALPMIWTRIMLPFESTIDEETMELSAQLAALEMIRSGTTAFVEAGSYHMETAAGVYADSGLRGLLSCSTMDDPSLPASIRHTTGEAVAQTDRLYELYHGKGLLQIAYSLRSLMSCSPELIQRVSEHARERGAVVQAHMNEYPGEVNYFLKKHGVRPFVYLAGQGVLGPHFAAAHALLLSEEEKDLIREFGVKVCHCPFSNCGKGVPDTPSLLGRGVSVGLGSDGAAHGGLSLWNEMKIFRSVMNATIGVQNAQPDIMPARTILRMATRSGYALMGVEGGTVRVGAPADLITVRMDAPHLYPTGNAINTLVECVTASDVCDTIVGGRLLMRDRNVLTLDEGAIMRRARSYVEQKEGKSK